MNFENLPHKHFDIVFTESLLAICTASGSEKETTEVCTAELSAKAVNTTTDVNKL